MLASIRALSSFRALFSGTHIVEGSLSTRRPYSDKNAKEAGRTPREARNGRVSAPAAVTMIASLRFCRMVRLKLAQKKISAKGTSFCHRVTGSGRFASISFKLSAGTWNNRKGLQSLTYASCSQISPLWDSSRLMLVQLVKGGRSFPSHLIKQGAFQQEESA